MAEWGRTTQLSSLLLTSGEPAAFSAQLSMLVATIPESPDFAETSQMFAMTGRLGAPIPFTTQAAMLVAYRTGPIENFRQRAWTFTLDGHPFYVLTLGPVGTFVLDTATGQWSAWETEGYEGIWNMELGVDWRGGTVAGDNSNPLLWRLEPDSWLDEEFRPIRRTVTAITPIRARDTQSHDGLYITASVGDPTDDPAQLTLRFSDDNGVSFDPGYTVEIEAGAFRQELAFLSLGQIEAPGRVYEVSDFGGLVRIDGADLETDSDG